MVVVETSWTGKQCETGRAVLAGLKGSGVSPSGDLCRGVCPESLCKGRARWEASCPHPTSSFLSNSVHCLAVCPGHLPPLPPGVVRFAHS